MDEAERKTEYGLEEMVSRYICTMPFLCLNVSDEPGPNSQRKLIESNAIALLSSYSEPVIDRPSSKWLGQFCDRDRVRCSGLWNQDHVDEQYDSLFLDVMENWIEETKPL